MPPATNTAVARVPDDSLNDSRAINPPDMGGEYHGLPLSQEPRRRVKELAQKDLRKKGRGCETTADGANRKIGRFLRAGVLAGFTGQPAGYPSCAKSGSSRD